MNKPLSSAIVISAVLLSIVASVGTSPVRADVASIKFIDSDLTVYSPLNITYDQRSIDLLVTVPLKSGLSEDGSVSMNYSIDGVYTGSVTLHEVANSTPFSGAAWIDLGTGTASLPELPDGSHRLFLYLYGINMQNYQPVFKSYVETVYFSVYDPNSVFIPTPDPKPSVLTSKDFTPSNTFAIPALNGSISFAYNGSYNTAMLENNFWSFDGLVIESLGSCDNVISFDLSAQNCRVTINHVDTLKWPDQVGWLTYNVEGEGNQTFNMHWRAQGFVIGFKVYIDGMPRDQGNGWFVWAGQNHVTDNMLTVTGAKNGVSIGFALDPQSIGSEPNFEQSSPIPSFILPPTPSATPIISLSPSPTMQLTLEPSLTASPTPVAETWATNLTLEIAGIVTMTIVVAGLVVYFQNRKNK